ncbi:MAG TPA: hypothetical protein VGR72_10235 [Candidatus Acidoferrales bacterium]|nr:hypothetical protein [Candidatus Acidoferrales bacterium]
MRRQLKTVLIRVALESGGAGPLLVNRGADKGRNFGGDLFQVMGFARVLGGLCDDFIARGAAGYVPALVKDFAAAENLRHLFPPAGRFAT